MNIPIFIYISIYKSHICSVDFIGQHCARLGRGHLVVGDKEHALESICASAKVARRETGHRRL